MKIFQNSMITSTKCFACLFWLKRNWTYSSMCACFWCSFLTSETWFGVLARISHQKRLHKSDRQIRQRNSRENGIDCRNLSGQSAEFHLALLFSASIFGKQIFLSISYIILYIYFSINCEFNFLLIWFFLYFYSFRHWLSPQLYLSAFNDTRWISSFFSHNTSFVSSKGYEDFFHMALLPFSRTHHNIYIHMTLSIPLRFEDFTSTFLLKPEWSLYE